MIKWTILALICCEIVAASVFWGAVHVWMWTILIVASWIILGLSELAKIRAKEYFRIPYCIGIVLTLFLVSLTLQQIWNVQVTLPIPLSLQSSLQEMGAKAEIPSIINKYQAKLALYQWVIPVAAFLAVPFVLSARRHLYILMISIVAICGLQGFYGILQALSTTDPCPFFATPDKQGTVGGTYVCRNTYACFLAMGVPLSLGLLVELARRHGGISMKHGLQKNPWLPGIFVIFLLMILMILGIFLSLSRGGVVCLCAGSLLFVVLLHKFSTSSSAQSRMWYLLVPLPPLVYLWLIDLDPLWGRFSDTALGGVGRWSLCAVAWQIGKHHWLLGCGGGCFSYAFNIYKPPELLENYRYAHNDFLQFFAEYGIVSSVLLAAFLVLWCYIVIRRPRKWIPAGQIISPGIWCGSLASLAVLFLHGLVDFSLYIPGHRLLGAVLMGVLLVTTYRKNSVVLKKEDITCSS